MSQKGKMNYEEKIGAIKEYKTGKGSYETIANKYGISDMCLEDMIATYEIVKKAAHPRLW